MNKLTKTLWSLLKGLLYTHTQLGFLAIVNTVVDMFLHYLCCHSTVLIADMLLLCTSPVARALHHSSSGNLRVPYHFSCFPSSPVCQTTSICQLLVLSTHSILDDTDFTIISCCGTISFAAAVITLSDVINIITRCDDVISLANAVLPITLIPLLAVGSTK